MMPGGVASGYLGILTADLHIPSSGSLKGKRRHVQRAKAQLQQRYGASVAEVDFHDLWQRARLTLVIVRREAGDVQDALADAERYLSAQEYVLSRATRRVLSVEDDL